MRADRSAQAVAGIVFRSPRMRLRSSALTLCPSSASADEGMKPWRSGGIGRSLSRARSGCGQRGVDCVLWNEEGRVDAGGAREVAVDAVDSRGGTEDDVRLHTAGVGARSGEDLQGGVIDAFV